MRAIVVKIFEGLEEKLQEDYPPEQYAWNGHPSSARRLLISFGEVRYSLAQVTERKTGKSINPLVVKLKIPAYRHYPGEALEASLGQAIHLSYRLAAKETKRIRGSGPGPFSGGVGASLLDGFEDGLGLGRPLRLRLELDELLQVLRGLGVIPLVEVG